MKRVLLHALGLLLSHEKQTRSRQRFPFVGVRGVLGREPCAAAVPSPASRGTISTRGRRCGAGPGEGRCLPGPLWVCGAGLSRRGGLRQGEVFDTRTGALRVAVVRSRQRLPCAVRHGRPAPAAPRPSPGPGSSPSHVLLGFVFAPFSPLPSAHRLTSLFTRHNTEQIAQGLPETPRAGARAMGARGG